MVISKPADLHDRDRQWATLSRFATTERPGATLGLVYGRRRQGKTLLLRLLAREVDGLFFTGLRQGGPLNLRRLAETYAEFTGDPLPRFDGWDQAIHALLALGERRERPTLVVLDEFTYLERGGRSEMPAIVDPITGPTRRGKACSII